jgi:hypothetical protein
MDNDRPQFFQSFVTRRIIVLVTLFASLAIEIENVAAEGSKIPTAADPVGAQGVVIVGTFYDPIKTFDNPNQFATNPLGIPVLLDAILRDGDVTPPSPVCAWVTGDYGDEKGRNYLEGGMSAQFVFLKKNRFPLILTVPANMAAGDEEYRFGPAFEYIVTGINVGVPLSFIPSRYGRWTAGSSAELCYYGTTQAEFVKSIGLHMPKFGVAFAVSF